MMERLNEKEHDSTFEAVLGDHGTHFILPEGMMKRLALGWLIDFFVAYAFKEAKGFKKECRETRKEIDRCISKAIEEW